MSGAVTTSRLNLGEAKPPPTVAGAAWLTLGEAKRGLGAEAPCWLDRAFAENRQHEAEAPRPRFAASRLRVNPAAESEARPQGTAHYSPQSRFRPDTS